MNSDNSALGGVTLDYGPFAFMEKFVPMYNPWVGGGTQYAFGRQPQAAAVNLAGLAPSFIELVQLEGSEEGLSKAERDAAVEEIKQAVQMGYVDTFHAKHDDNCRAKLGLAAWDDDAQELSPGVTRSQVIRGTSILAYGTLLGSTVTAESSPSYVNAVRRAINGAAPQAGLNVLEVGYGTGPNLETYPRGTRLMALDAQLQVGQGSDMPTHLRGLQEGWK